MPRILTPDSHGDETMEIAHDMLPPGYELVTAPHGRPEFWNLLKDFRLLYRRRPVQARSGILSASAEAEARADLERRLQYLRSRSRPRRRRADCNNGGANATAVAEHAVMLMLAVSRKLIWQHDGVVSGRWRGNDFSSTKLYELEDKTLGIVGLGNIGKKVARRAKAFDMRIQYYDINRMTTDQEDALGVRSPCSRNC